MSEVARMLQLVYLGHKDFHSNRQQKSHSYEIFRKQIRHLLLYVLISVQGKFKLSDWSRICVFLTLKSWAKESIVWKSEEKCIHYIKCVSVNVSVCWLVWEPAINFFIQCLHRPDVLGFCLSARHIFRPITSNSLNQQYIFSVQTHNESLYFITFYEKKNICTFLRFEAESPGHLRKANSYICKIRTCGLYQLMGNSELKSVSLFN